MNPMKLKDGHPISSDACRLLARLPNNRQGRAAVKCLRDNWNRAGWRLRVLFSGPRTGWTTNKADAHTFRLYADRVGFTSYERAAQEYRASEQRELADARNQLRDMRQALMLAESSAVIAREQYGEAEGRAGLAQVELGAARMAVEMWRASAAAHQRALNAVPAWILWLVGFATDARATWARFTATRRAA